MADEIMDRIRQRERKSYIVLSVVVAILAVVAGVLGWKVGNAPPRSIEIYVHVDQPLVVKGQ